MGFLNNILLKTKLFAVVGFLIAVALGISVTVYTYVRHIVEQTSVMQEDSEQVFSAGRATANLLSYARAVEFLPLDLTDDQRSRFEAEANDELKRLRARLDKLLPTSERGKAELRSIRDTLAAYEKEVQLPVATRSRAKDLDGATRIAFAGAEPMVAMRRSLRALEDEKNASFTHEIKDLAEDQQSLLNLILVIAGGGSALGIIAAFTTIVMGITRPLLRIIETMRELASGSLDCEVSGVERRDEIGDMARSVQVFVENAVERQRLEARSKSERAAEAQRQSKTEMLISDFRRSMSSIRETLDEQLEGMKHSSETLSNIAMSAADGANSAQAASSEASNNVGDVANAAGELTAASREISTQVHKASDCVTRAMAVARQADDGISSLAELADRIGAIVHMINGIAEQTNMLALNATIEAARAGEAGRSFAVVASEVKTLAGQTAKATDEISTQVSSIQSATQSAVQFIRTISETVSEIQGRTTAIAAAVEEQEASTLEISRSISLASNGSERVAQDVTSMAGSVEKTSDEAGVLRETTDRLAEVAGQLSRSVDTFLEGVTEDHKDRRNAIRRATRELLLITSNGKRFETRAVDISETGLRIECAKPLAVGERMELEFLNGERAKGHVVWWNNGQAGIALDERIPQIVVDAMAA